MVEREVRNIRNLVELLGKNITEEKVVTTLSLNRYFAKIFGLDIGITLFRNMFGRMPHDSQKLLEEKTYSKDGAVQVLVGNSKVNDKNLAIKVLEFLGERDLRLNDVEYMKVVRNAAQEYEFKRISYQWGPD